MKKFIWLLKLTSSEEGHGKHSSQHGDPYPQSRRQAAQGLQGQRSAQASSLAPLSFGQVEGGEMDPHLNFYYLGGI